MRRIVTIPGIVALLAVAGPAAASTIHVANDCSGQPTPCTTDLQSALDDGSYDTVEIVADASFTGDYLITRSLTLTGNSGSKIEHPSRSAYCLRVEGTTSGVTVEQLELAGRAATYDSEDVLWDDLDHSSADVAHQVIDSNQVTLRESTVTAGNRVVGAQDSKNVKLYGGDLDADAYGAVGSDADLVAYRTDLYGVDNAIVLQEGDSSITPQLDADHSTLDVGRDGETTWRWDQSRSDYDDVSPSPSEDVTSDASLVSKYGYTPETGD